MWFESMHPTWQSWLASEREWLANLETTLLDNPQLAPDAGNVMAAFSQDPSKIRVVIVGQDPYHTPGVAIGKAFAVAEETQKLPPSLRNIFKELVADVGGSEPTQSLSGWQQQGVFLLNRHLTTVLGEAGAHSKLGWAQFTDSTLRQLALNNPKVIYILWGSHAQQLKPMLLNIAPDASPRVVESVHPSPLSAHRGFFGSKPFSKTNQLLIDQGLATVNWNI